MAILATFKQGESVSLCFSLPISYDLNRIRVIKVYLGSKLLTHTITDNVVKCDISSDDTKFLSGIYKIVFVLDDTILAVKKTYCDSVIFNATGASYHNANKNTGFDLLFPLIITETAISVDVPLYNYFKGADGDNGITPHIDEETGNWFVGDTDTGIHAQGDKGDKGDKGDVAGQQYSVESANLIIEK